MQRVNGHRHEWNWPPDSRFAHCETCGETELMLPHEDQTLRSRVKRALLLTLIVAAALTATCIGADAQSHPDTVEVRVAAGTWFFALRAFNAAGLQSGYSNEVRVVCAPAAGETTCPVRLFWDRNTETDLAGYRLGWGSATGAYVQTQAIPVDLTGGQQRLAAPTLRIRR